MCRCGVAEQILEACVGIVEVEGNVHSAGPNYGQHRNHELRRARQRNGNPVSYPNTALDQSAGKHCRPMFELGVPETISADAYSNLATAGNHLCQKQFGQ